VAVADDDVGDYDDLKQ